MSKEPSLLTMSTLARLGAHLGILEAQTVDIVERMGAICNACQLFDGCLR